MSVKSVTVTKSKTKVMPVLSWQTILYNCDCHEFWEVVDQIMLAIKCTEPVASQYATLLTILVQLLFLREIKKSVSKWLMCSGVLD